MTNPNTINDDNLQSVSSPEGIRIPMNKSERLTILIESFRRVQEAILRNAPVSESMLQPIRESLHADAEEIRNDSEIKANRKIWEEIEQGSYVHANDLILLNDSIARTLAGIDVYFLRLNNLLIITDTQAEILAQSHSKGALCLDGLTKVSDKQAAALSQYAGGDLILSGLETIEDKQAAALSRFTGRNLILNGLASLSDDQAESLSRYKGVLTLAGLQSMSEKQAASFASSKLEKLCLGSSLRFHTKKALQSLYLIKDKITYRNQELRDEIEAAGPPSKS